MNTLIRELEKRKYLIYISNYSLCVKMYGIELKFGIRKISRKIHLHDPKAYPDYDFFPTGKFTLSINELYSDYSIRKNFTDNRTGKIEDKLNDFIVALIIAAHEQLGRKKHLDEIHLQWQEEEKQRKDLAERIKLEEDKIEELGQNVELWHKSELIRQFIHEYKKNCLIDSLDETKKKEVIDYCNWALLQANRVDPFKESPYSIVDDKEKNTRFFH